MTVLEQNIQEIASFTIKKAFKENYDNSVTVEQMKTSLNKQLIVGIAAGGTTLILLKGGDYKWLLLVGFAAILFVFAYVYKK